MNGTNFENMIKRYSDELLKMNREKALPDPAEQITQEKAVTVIAQAAEITEEDAPPEETTEAPRERRAEIADIPGIEATDFFQSGDMNEDTEEEESFPPFSLDDPADFAFFSARVFTGNNAYPIEDARVIVLKDNKLFTFLSTDSDGVTKRIKLPTFPESNSLDPQSNQQYVEYTGEVYAQGFTPKKNLLISAVGGSYIVLDVQMTPVDERVN